MKEQRNQAPKTFVTNFEVSSRTSAEDKPFAAKRINGLWHPQFDKPIEHKGDTDLTFRIQSPKMKHGWMLLCGSRCLARFASDWLSFAGWDGFSL